MTDVRCPYCGEGQEINHDDGYGYDEMAIHQQECFACENTFTFTTQTHFSYDTGKADCLNGWPHVPSYYSRPNCRQPHTDYCRYCDHDGNLTAAFVGECGEPDDKSRKIARGQIEAGYQAIWEDIAPSQLNRQNMKEDAI
ncbi:MAG: hypothetical protein P1U50_00900 [Parvibaculaceae bacterium]|nr:hypothetical protein [Parvibaculaceae bacterium]